MVVNGGGAADGDLPLLVPIVTSLSLALAAAFLGIGPTSAAGDAQSPHSPRIMLTAEECPGKLHGSTATL
ncbi:hypothetical protein MRX96_015405 [Rhipicephalus microplus]